MNIIHREKLVLLGFLSHFPVAGVAWQTIHYLVGLRRLGYDVYYVEAHGCTPSKLMQSETDDGSALAAEYIAGLMRRFSFEGHWAYHPIYENRCFGMSQTQLKALYREAALLINLHGSHLPTPELTVTNRLVYVGTDPVDIEIDVFHAKQEAFDYLKPHCAFFTYGERLGQPDCLVPEPQAFTFRPTRQPVVIEFWENYGLGGAAVFTTIGNWRQPWREVRFQGESYKWSKHFEFLKYIDLPRRVSQPLELALSGYVEKDQRLLEHHGWRVRPALDLSQDLDVYRRYIGASRGEFTVAKDQNIRLRSGWFSDRAATYLATGRPVVTQETGFSRILPTGEGLFAFSTMEEAVGAIEAINADYARHRQAARRIAQEHFSHEVVLGQMVRDLGLNHSATRPALEPGPSSLPSWLVIVPTSRWPTHLPDRTRQHALALRPPGVKPPLQLPPPPPPTNGSVRPPVVGTVPDSDARATIIIVTHGGLAYTKLCLTTLLHGWAEGDDLIVVDNASRDGSAEFLREFAARHPFVHVLFNETNCGFAKANNQALRLATGDVFILLNNDTLTSPGWRDSLVRWLEDHTIGLVGPVTNRTCNEAQIDAPYRTLAEMVALAQTRSREHRGEGTDIPMLAMFCLAMRRDIFQHVGPLDEQYALGMFEDDDYAMRVRQAGYRIVCAEDVFIHHFGQASLGELCADGEYDRLFTANRQRFETKWGLTWKPHGRRLSPEYRELRRRVRATVEEHLPPGATVAVFNKGDEELLHFAGRRGWHFPRAADGGYANTYPAHSTDAITQLESLHASGADFFLLPKPGFWWLEYYDGFRDHLETRYPLVVREPDTCLIYNLGGNHAA